MNSRRIAIIGSFLLCKIMKGKLLFMFAIQMSEKEKESKTMTYTKKIKRMRTFWHDSRQEEGGKAVFEFDEHSNPRYTIVWVFESPHP